MVKKRGQVAGTELKPPLLLAVPREQAERQISERIEKGELLKHVRISSFDDLKRAEDEFSTWSSYNVEMLRRLFTSPEYADEYAFWGAFAVGRDRDLARETREYLGEIDTKIHRLQSIKARLELVPEHEGATPAIGAPTRSTPEAIGNRAFVVHGHDDAARESVARFLERLGIEPVILHEQASASRTIIEKLEHHGDVGFAVVLLTADDVGGKDSDSLRPRARQNVMLELGYFVGRLGRSRVCALHKSPVEVPSDFLGVVYVPLDAAGAWRLLLARELRDAGFAIDMNAAI